MIPLVLLRNPEGRAHVCTDRRGDITSHMSSSEQTTSNSELHSSWDTQRLLPLILICVSTVSGVLSTMHSKHGPNAQCETPLRVLELL